MRNEPATARISRQFEKLVEDLGDIGQDWHAGSIVENSRRNRPFIEHSIRDIALPVGRKAELAIVVSAGPSLYKNDILPRLKRLGYQGTIVAVDGSMMRCFKAELRPDYVLTLDPHPTRIVRWFGDPDFEKNSEGDDYFRRQDLDIAFRNDSTQENLKNIEMVNRHGRTLKLVICSTAPENVVNRARQVGFEMYWWAPLVDNPRQEASLTRTIVQDTRLPAMNTGGTVGTAAWVFATAVLGIPRVAVVGMDFGYYRADTSYRLTQRYYILRDMVGEENLPDYFPEVTFPSTGETFYTDPTYYWYRRNLMDLVSASGCTLYNCTGAGTLFGPGVECMSLEQFVGGG